MADSLAPYNFSLPPQLIAQHPPTRRDGGKLLIVAKETVPHFCAFRRLPQFLSPNDLLIVNDSRVLPARLLGHKNSGGKVEILLERFISKSDCLVQIGSAKPPKTGTELNTDGGRFIVRGREGRFYRLTAINAQNQAVQAITRFQRGGRVPLPPYIRRSPLPADGNRYQTIFARQNGSVAAPTAGLHFSPELLNDIKNRNIQLARLTLHVGAGTFLPIQGDINKHVMHQESYSIPQNTATAINNCKKRGGRIIAVGTTVLRALESVSLQNGGAVQKTQAHTDLFIRPGFNFQVVDALITNFHLPRSSLLLLVCAFGGYRRVLDAYQYAIAEQLRFYSYGDAMLLQR